MIGWHYTSYENWLKIQTEGLRPYPISKPDLARFYPDATVMGIWAWIDRPVGLAHAGNCVYQMATKGVSKVVMLKVRYDKKDTVGPGGFHLLFHHDGHIEQLVYHDGSQTAYVVGVPIPPEDIELVEVFDLVTAFKPRKEKHETSVRNRMAG